MDKAIRRLRGKGGVVKPCRNFCCRQCNPYHYRDQTTSESTGSGNVTKKQSRSTRYTRIQPYPSQCVAQRVAETLGCKEKDVNKHVLQARLKKAPNSFHYFMAFKEAGVTSMRKLGGGGFGKVCRDYQPPGSGTGTSSRTNKRGCSFGAKCRFKHPGTFQKQSVYHTLPLNWPPVPHVGRLDVATEGLLMFTDDGRLQSALLKNFHSSPGSNESLTKLAAVEKVYVVQVSRLTDTKSDTATGVDQNHTANGQPVVTSSVVDSLKQPLHYTTDSNPTKPAKVKVLTSKSVKRMLKAIPHQHTAGLPPRGEQPQSEWIQIGITEGRNRQVRRLCERAGLRVLRLIRWSFGALSLNDLRGAKARALTPEQVGWSREWIC